MRFGSDRISFSIWVSGFGLRPAVPKKPQLDLGLSGYGVGELGSLCFLILDVFKRVPASRKNLDEVVNLNPQVRNAKP